MIDYILFALKVLLITIALSTFVFIVELLMRPIKFFEAFLRLHQILFGEDKEYKFSKRVFWRGFALILVLWIAILLFSWYKNGFP